MYSPEMNSYDQIRPTHFICRESYCFPPTLIQLRLLQINVEQKPQITTKTATLTTTTTTTTTSATLTTTTTPTANSLRFLVIAGELIGGEAELVDECRSHLLHLVIVKSLRGTKVSS